MPHEFVDAFIRKNYHKMIDKEIVEKLLKREIDGVNLWNVRYRRRKLVPRKYLYGEVKKHRAWIRAEAIKKYGTKCELCNYGMTINTHHVIPRYQGGLHEIDNLMVICPNCHALITRGITVVKNRKDIEKVRKYILKSLKKFYLI